MNGQYTQTKRYVCYHILPKDGKPGKVGATENLDKRVIAQQVGKGAKYGIDWVVLREHDNLSTISKTEEHFQILFGYPVDATSFEDIKKMNKVSKTKYAQDKGEAVVFSLSNNKSWYSVYYTSDIIELYEDIKANGVKVDGNVYNDEDTIKLFTGVALQRSKFGPGFFIGSRVVDDHFGNMEMTIAHKKWLGGDVEVTINTPVKVVDTEAFVEPQEKVTIDQVFAMQKELQQRFPETKNIGNQSIAATAKAAQRNWHAFTDEVMEYMDALGGINDGIGNAGWKYWKADNEIAKKKKVKRLSKGDLEELKYEYVDMFHFFINWGLMIGMEGQELLDMYAEKNKINHQRQDENY